MENELKEEWREYNRYQVSNYGKVINKHGKSLSMKADMHGYICTSITDYNGDRIKGMHRIIATVFIPNPLNLPEVNHKDGIKSNNRVDNLEWCTKKHNMKHRSEVLGCMVGTDNPTNKLTEEQVLEIYNLCKNTDIKYKDIAKMYGVIPEEVNRIAFGVVWKHLGLDPLPKLVRGSRSRGKKLIWINQDKPYPSMKKCSEDMENTYNIKIDVKVIAKICNGTLEEYKGQKFKFTT
jgi:hypothetical protein